jgi:peptidoglycan hydrolase-like protein with peptidoglycan-binding domain
MRDRHRASGARLATTLAMLTVLGAACSSAAGDSSPVPGEARATLGLTTETSSPEVPAPPTSAAPETTAAPATSADAGATPPVTEDPTSTSSAVEAPSTSDPAVPRGSNPVSDQTALPYLATAKDSGPETKRVQIRLIELGFWVSAADGTYGLTTTQALIAFQKFSGLRRTGIVDDATAAALTAARFRATATATDGTLVEVDKDRQLLFLIQNGRTTWTFNTSTGSGTPYVALNLNDQSKIEIGDAVTPSGLWTVNREHDQGWWDGDLGKIYRPKYFHNGIAIHGMNSVPAHPASHGCVRLSLPAMDFIWANDLVPLGMTVWVHGTP